jgi:ornithine cyclodeaminase/alanine dehydrogenase-like protein (mu-crystallin family)
MTIPFLDAAAVRAALPPAAAVAAIEQALRDGLDPAAAVPRQRVDVAHGQLLLMPAESAGHAGVKLVAVAPGNPARGLPLIHGVYVLFDAVTLRPAALLDGSALTTLRTPAVTVAALRPFLPDRPLRVVVFGAGPQGTGHLETLGAVHEIAHADVVTRSTRAAIDVDAALRQADVVVCATTARAPLFDSALLADDAVVAAVGSHEPDAREVDAAFCARATVVVEDVATALRECGDVVLAVAEGALVADDLVPMRDVVRAGGKRRGPVLYKGSGMSWQDLVAAEAVLRNATPG